MFLYLGSCHGGDVGEGGDHVVLGDLAGVSSVGGGCAKSPEAGDGDLGCLVGHLSGQRVRARVSSLDRLHGKRPYLLTIDSVSSIVLFRLYWG